MEIKFESPLQWLPQQPRTNRPERARFSSKHNISYAGRCLVDELRLMGAKDCVISSNLKRTMSGNSFYSNQKVEDSGVVIYFNLKDKDKAMACDLWDKPEHNLWALYLSVKAIRGLERWGGSDFLDGLFTGFKALPSPEDITVMTTRYFSDVMNKEHLELKYKKLAKELHPDNMFTGNTEEFQEMIIQYKQRKENI